MVETDPPFQQVIAMVTPVASMQELELKLQIPAGSRASVIQALDHRRPADTPVQRQRLQATYFDTAQRHLAAAGVALRIRREGRAWVQTLKASGAHAMERLEHNVRLPGTAAQRPALNLALHAATPAGQRLLRALDMPSFSAYQLDVGTAPVVEQFSTDIWRRTRRLRTRYGSVELAFDEGQIIANGRTLPVCELEIELLSGQALAVLHTAQRWIERHGLWLDTQTKAHRGMLLASDLRPPPVKGQALTWPAHASLEQAWSQLHAWLFDILLDNASALAAPHIALTPSSAQRPEAIRLLRVALRRLRVGWQMFQGTGIEPDADMHAAARTLFAELGQLRDQDVLGDLIKALQTAGAPPLPTMAAMQATAPVDIVAMLRSPQVNRLWLAVLGNTQYTALESSGASSTTPSPGLPDWETWALVQLRRWHKQTAASIKGFDKLDEAGVHELRKKLKRLRYGVEAVQKLLPHRPSSRYLRRLSRAQDALGAYTDLVMAQTAMRSRSLDAAAAQAAWFALGWISAQLPVRRSASKQALQSLLKAPKFWP